MKEASGNNRFIELVFDEHYLVGTKFELKSVGIYEDTTVTCLSGDSIFTDQVYAGSTIVLKNNENSFIELVVKSVTNNTTLVVEGDNYDNSTGITFQRACLKHSVASKYVPIINIDTFFKDPSDNKLLIAYDQKLSREDIRFLGVTTKPEIIYDPAGVRGLNDLTIPINPTKVDGYTSIKVTIDAAAIAQVTTIATVADSNGSLDNKYFVLAVPGRNIVIRLYTLESESNTDYLNKLGLENTEIINVKINENDSANTIASLIKTSIDDHIDFSASVSTNTVTVTCATAGKVGDIFDPVADKTATTISARTFNNNYGSLFDSASGFSTSYIAGQKVNITTEGGIIDGVYTIQRAAADQIVLKERFPLNVDSTTEPDDFSTTELGSVTIEAGRTGFTITSNGSGSSVVGKNDTFKTSFDGGSNFIETGTEILGDHVLGGSGSKARGGGPSLVVVNFKNTVGHTLNDSWIFFIEFGNYIKIKNSTESLLGLPEKIKRKVSDIYKY